MVVDEDSACSRTQWVAVSHTDRDWNRGQIYRLLPRGAVAVTVLAGPLTAAAADIQFSLVAVPGLSLLSGSVISLLFVATRVAAALGAA